MREDQQDRLRRVAAELGRTAIIPPPRAVRDRGDRRRRRRALGSGLLALALLAGGGAAYLTIARQQPAAPPLHHPTGTPTPALSARPTPRSSGSPSPTTAAMLPAGQVGPRSAVPWKLIGPGWVLAEYTEISSIPPFLATRPTILYLVDPAGGRYEMYRWPAGLSMGWALLDWSGDRTRALLEATPVNGPNALPTLHQLVLATGAMTTVKLPPGVNGVRYTRPDGTNLLAITGSQGAEKVERFDLAGALQATLANGTFGNPVSSADGAVVALGASTGVEVVSNAGGSARLLGVPGVDRLFGCSAVRWWNSDTVLAVCAPSSVGSSRLWLVPVNGGSPSPLTPPRLSGPDLGDLDAWQLPSGLYLQAAGACGTQFIARQAPDGSITADSPDGQDNVRVLAVVGSRMLVRVLAGCPGAGSLLWFDPATGATQTLLAPPPGELGVTEAVPYGRPNG